MKTSIILPTYNEKENIVELIQTIFATLEPLDLDFQVVVVDDNSPDGTAEAVQQGFGQNGQVKLCVRTEVRGLATAIRHGIDHSDGDILVFGLHQEMDEILSASELRQRYADMGVYMVAAHPFRGFLLFGFSELSLTPERAAERPIFQAVDAIEAYNCKVSRPETEMAFEVAARLQLPCVAGSDAHKVADVGKLYTHFEKTISSEEELIAELVAGRFSVEPLRQ